MTTEQSEHLKKAFLDIFRRTGNISQSCAAAGIGSRTTIYNWQEHDEAFALEYKHAEIEATELLEVEAHRRAVFGVQKDKPIFHQGEMVGLVQEREYSDTLLIFLLKARAPHKYRERVDVTTDGQPLIKYLAGVDPERAFPKA